MQTLTRNNSRIGGAARTARFRRGDEAPLVVGRISAGLFGEPHEVLVLSLRARSPRIRGAANGGGALDIRAGAPHRVLAREGLLCFPADRIFKGVVEALTAGALEADPDSVDGWPLRFPLTTRAGKDRLVGTIGFRRPPSDAVRKLLEGSSPLAIKAHYALWARQFAEAEGHPGTPVSLTLSRLCDDLGFVRLQNGAHRPEHKRQAAALLELLSTLELEAEYQAPDGRPCRLHGPIWQQVVLDGEITVAPGPWFHDPVWRTFNSAVGLVGEGLLKLRQDRDRWTLCLAGYLAPLARMNGYRPLTLRFPTLEERIGLARAERRNPARRREMLERALDRCVEAGLLGSWDFTGEASREPDMDSPTDLTALAAPDRTADLRVTIHWPPALRGREPKLRSARERQYKSSLRRQSTPAHQ